MIKHWNIFKYSWYFCGTTITHNIWFLCIYSTCMFRRPLRAENPWWDIEDASIWSSSTRWDSKPRGGHSERRETLDHSYLKARKSYDNSTDSFLWAVVFQTLTNYLSFFSFFQPFVLNKRWSWSQQQFWAQKARNSSWKPKSLWGKNMSALTFTAFSSGFAHWTNPNTHVQKKPCVFALIIMWFVAVFQKYSLFGSA